MFLTKFTIDNSQSQVEKKEGSNEYNQVKVGYNIQSSSLLKSKHVASPALQSDYLKYLENSPENIIEIRASEIRISRCLSALKPRRTILLASAGDSII